jgi:hypothetical protein
MLKIIKSFRKGQTNVSYSDDVYEKVLLVTHSNTLIPILDTLHFGIKPGHFMLYVKKRGQMGRWEIKDAGYLNYFRKDKTEIVQTEYNTLSKQKLFSNGFTFSFRGKDESVKIFTISLLPFHIRYFNFSPKSKFLNVKDFFLFSSTVFTNYNDFTLKQKKWLYNQNMTPF